MPLLVETRFGFVRGRLDRGVTVFRGIPYARAPDGPHRFQAPKRLEPWTRALDCGEPGPAAPQNEPRLAALFGRRELAQSEDCLRLDVWTPAFEGQPRPVLVYVHGGGFAEGAASDPGARGRRLARGGDVVVVSLQYRLGALGFLDPADLPRDAGLSTANLGLLDQIAALEWVRDEIDAFGGDARNVTLFGAGAGATSVACLLAAPRARGLFARAILSSGSYRVDAREDSTRRTRALLAALALRPADARKLADLPASTLLDAQRRAGGFRPVVDGDLLTAPPLAALRAGSVAPHGVMLGTNSDETRLLELEDARLRELDDAGLRTRLREQGLDGELVERTIAAYANARPGATPNGLFHAIETDRRYRAPALRLADALAAAGAPVHLYEFAFSGRTAQGPTGAFHGLEQPFVFGTRRIHPLGALIEDLPAAKALSRRMRDAWTSYARSGDPRAPLSGSWPGYTAADRRVRRFDAEPELEAAPAAEPPRFWAGAA